MPVTIERCLLVICVVCLFVVCCYLLARGLVWFCFVLICVIAFGLFSLFDCGISRFCGWFTGCDVVAYVGFLC